MSRLTAAAAREGGGKPTHTKLTRPRVKKQTVHSTVTVNMPETMRFWTELFQSLVENTT